MAMEPAFVAVLTCAESQFLAHLTDRTKVTRSSAERVQRVVGETSAPLTGILLKLGLVSEETLAHELAQFSGFARFAGEQLPARPVATPGLNIAFFRAREVVPLSMDAERLLIACWDCLDDYVVRALRFACGLGIECVLGTRSEVAAALDRLYPHGAAPAATGPIEIGEEEIDRLKDLASEAPIIRLVQRLITDAVVAKASDIHLEVSSEALHVRLRTDGLLHEAERHEKQAGAAVVSRIKVIAGLNIAERRLPQDGRIRVMVHGKEIDFRVATSPTLHGESVVLRILDREDIALDFDALGFDATTTSVLREAIQRPHGIVLVSGPTGSGKTTTLYAALKEINHPQRKILTIEDPVEYVLDGINQVPLRPQIGLTFAAALRAFLRQDPDVLMVGEIRDRETAEIAVQASLTGHLLLSTVHTNSAAGSITRLLDMGIDDYLLTSTLHLIVAQRLVRRLCNECKVLHEPPAELCSALGIDPPASGWYRAVGCTSCQGSGYRGRTTIIELLPMTDAVRARVLAHADANLIEQAAVDAGMRTLFAHGLERVSDGITSIDEVRRVTSARS
jgi:general secretion pathway protein E